MSDYGMSPISNGQQMSYEQPMSYGVGRGRTRGKGRGRTRGRTQRQRGGTYRDSNGILRSGLPPPTFPPRPSRNYRSRGRTRGRTRGRGRGRTRGRGQRRA